MTTAYAGIGSRSSPLNVREFMTRIAIRLDNLGFTLRSGGAAGADTAFSMGVSSSRQAVYLPWHTYNDWYKHQADAIQLSAPSPEALLVAAELHPHWANLSQAVKKLMARNCHQILGDDLHSPVDFVICWTPDGAETARQRSHKTGGTGLAIELADRHAIPVFNLANHDALSRLSALVKQHPAYHSYSQSAGLCP